MNMVEFAVATRDQAPDRTEDIPLGRSEGHKGPGEVYFLGVALILFSQPDYKNNILKERAELAHSPLPAKNVDLDKGEYWTSPAIPHGTQPVPTTLWRGDPCHRF